MTFESNSFPVERVRELYGYDYETGFLISKSRTKSGKPVIGELCTNSMWSIRLYRKDGTSVKTNYARVVFCWHKGRWPEGEIDHIDRDPRNNRIDNLREADRFLQSQNRSCFNYGTHRCKKQNKWIAAITVNGKRRRIGQFETQKESQEAFLAECDKIGHPYLPPTLFGDRYVPAERVTNATPATPSTWHKDHWPAKKTHAYGAYRRKNCKKWKAVIRVNGKTKQLGSFETQKEAQERFMAECDRIGRKYLPPTLVDDRYVPTERLRGIR